MPPTSEDAAGTGGVPAFSGTRVTTVPLMPVAGAKPCIATVTLPLMSVVMVDTYFEAPPACVASQPQLLIPGALVALWETSGIEVRQALAAKITSDIFAP